MKHIPTAAEILTHQPTVPVKIAAAYLGESPQSVRERVKEGTLPVGYRSGTRTRIYSKKLVEFKEGAVKAESLDSRIKTVMKLIESGLVTFDEILELAVKKDMEAD